MATALSHAYKSLLGRRLGGDRALRSLAVKGDAAAFAALYERHHQELYRYCRAILHDDEDARDALQSAMARAFAALAGESRDFELRPWLFRIAHNEAISILRRRRETQPLEDAGSVAGLSLERRVDDRAGLRQLQADLAELSERQRAALVLRELSGLSHTEIAAVLEVSEKAAKEAIFGARATLHEFRAGRELVCTSVQRALSDGDGRMRRGRELRAHLRACERCRQFDDDLRRRPAELAAIAPALPMAASAMLFSHVIGGTKTAGAAAGGAGAVGSGVAASGSTVAGGALGVKVAAAVAVAALAGGGYTGVRAITASSPRTLSRPSAGRSATTGARSARVVSVQPRRGSGANDRVESRSPTSLAPAGARSVGGQQRGAERRHGRVAYQPIGYIEQGGGRRPVPARGGSGSHPSSSRPASAPGANGGYQGSGTRPSGFPSNQPQLPPAGPPNGSPATLAVPLPSAPSQARQAPASVPVISTQP